MKDVEEALIETAKEVVCSDVYSLILTFLLNCQCIFLRTFALVFISILFDMIWVFVFAYV